MKNREMHPAVERILFILIGVLSMIWILQYDMILIIPASGLILAVKELNFPRDISTKPLSE